MIRILELGADGGSIILYQFVDLNKKKWFYHSVNEMAYEDLDLEGVERDSKFSTTVKRAFKKMQEEYNMVLNLYPLEVNENYKETVIGFLKKNITTTNHHVDYHSWALALQMEEDELRALF